MHHLAGENSGRAELSRHDGRHIRYRRRRGGGGRATTLVGHCERDRVAPIVHVRVRRIRVARRGTVTETPAVGDGVIVGIDRAGAAELHRGALYTGITGIGHCYGRRILLLAREGAIRIDTAETKHRIASSRAKVVGRFFEPREHVVRLCVTRREEQRRQTGDLRCRYRRPCGKRISPIARAPARENETVRSEWSRIATGGAERDFGS